MYGGKRTSNFFCSGHFCLNTRTIWPEQCLDFNAYQGRGLQIRIPYRSKKPKNAYRFFWKYMGLSYENSPFSELAKLLTKIAFEGARVLLCTPDWGCTAEHAYWRDLLDRMTVGRVDLLAGPISLPEDSDTTMQAPEWTIVDRTLNPVPVCDLDEALLKEVMAKRRGLTLQDLKRR